LLGGRLARLRHDPGLSTRPFIDGGLQGKTKKEGPKGGECLQGSPAEPRYRWEKIGPSGKQRGGKLISHRRALLNNTINEKTREVRKTTTRTSWNAIRGNLPGKRERPHRSLIWGKKKESKRKKEAGKTLDRKRPRGTEQLSGGETLDETLQKRRGGECKGRERKKTNNNNKTTTQTPRATCRYAGFHNSISLRSPTERIRETPESEGN